MGDPEEDEHQNDDGDGEDGEDCGEEDCEEGVVAPSVAVGLAEVARHQVVVAAVGFPGDVEDVAEEGDGADEDLDGDVDHHAEEGDVGDAANPGGEDEDEGGDAGEDVAEAGDEADEAIEADADGGEGEAEPVVEEMREEVEIFVGAEALGALAEGGFGGERGSDAGSGRGGGFRREDVGFRGLFSGLVCGFGHGFWEAQWRERAVGPMLQSGLAWRL